MAELRLCDFCGESVTHFCRRRTRGRCPTGLPRGDEVDPTACPECIGMGCEACNGTGDAHCGVEPLDGGQQK